MKQNAPRMIIKEFLDRFRGILNHIKFKKMNSIKFSHELAKMIYLQESIYITAYRTGYSEEKTTYIFENEVIT
jgi:hypothetical protein